MTTAEASDPRPVREQVAEETRAWMGRRRISGVRLAESIGRSHSYVSRRLNGETAFDLDDLEAIADALNVPLWALMGASTPVGPDNGPATGGATGDLSRRYVSDSGQLGEVIDGPWGSVPPWSDEAVPA